MFFSPLSLQTGWDRTQVQSSSDSDSNWGPWVFLHPGVCVDPQSLGASTATSSLFWWVNLILSRSLAPKGLTPVCFFWSAWQRCECTRIDLVPYALSILLKSKVSIFLKGIVASVDLWCSQLKSVREVWCVLASQQLWRRFSMCPHVLVLSSMRPDGFWCHLHLLSTTQLGFTFPTLFLMFKSFSWPAPHISCLAVYSWWVWVLLWQRFLRSSAWRLAQVDYSNLPRYCLLFFPS